MNSKLKIREVLKEVKDVKGMLFGVPSGYESLDEVTHGFQKGNLYILAGRPAMGKSALAINIARKAAVESNKAVAYFTLEQGEEQITKRIISAQAEIELEKLYEGGLEGYEWDVLEHHTQSLREAPIFIKDYYKLTTDKLAKECQKLVEEGVELIILDDIQRVSLNEEQRKIAASREQEVSIVVRELKALAKELKVPIIAISQLNRAVETRGGDKRPILSDLRDSGALENDSDMVIFLYRPEYYGIQENEEGMPMQGIAELSIAKNRNGKLEIVQLRFVQKFTSFIENEMRYKHPNNYAKASKYTKSSGQITLGSKLNDEGKGKGKDKKGSSGFGYTNFPEDDNAPF